MSSFNVKNNDEYVSMVKQFLKSSMKLEHFLLKIAEENYSNYVFDEKCFKKLNYIDKKILITNFYINAIIKIFLYDFRSILLQRLKE